MSEDRNTEFVAGIVAGAIGTALIWAWLSYKTPEQELADIIQLQR